MREEGSAEDLLKRIPQNDIEKDARDITDIESGTIDLTVTSPPFLDILQYSNDNWLRFW